MFLRLIYFKNSTFPNVKTTADTLIDVRNETSKHHFGKIKYITLIKAMLHEAIFLATCNATMTNRKSVKLQRGCYTQAVAKWDVTG